jgi:hypothetical protein
MTAFRNHPARLAALANSAVKFDPGVPCINGHRALRYVSNSKCVVCEADYARPSRAKPKSEWGRPGRKPKPPTVFDKYRQPDPAMLSPFERKKKALFGGLHLMMEGAAARARSDYIDRVMRERTDNLRQFVDSPPPPPKRTHASKGVAYHRVNGRFEQI